MERIFSSKSFDPDEGFKRYSKVTQSAFYDGDVLVEDGEFNILIERILRRPVLIIHVLSRAQMSYRRNSKHIRANRGALKAIWIVRSGSVTIHSTNGVCEIGKNHVGIVDCDNPFKAIHSPASDDYYEAFQLLVPPDLFFQCLADVEFMSGVRLDRPQGHVVNFIIDFISQHGETLSLRTLNGLAMTLLNALADYLQQKSHHIANSCSIIDVRISEIEDFINLHASDPDMTSDIVSDSCRITPRYLRYLLANRGLTFSGLLWDVRLRKAHALLGSSEGRSLSIGKISSLSGFKCTTHFSRKFREAYGCSPREFRNSHGC